MISRQIENWIDEIGEPFLRDHVDTGSSLEETEKYCNDFTTFLDEVSLNFFVLKKYLRSF